MKSTNNGNVCHGFQQQKPIAIHMPMWYTQHPISLELTQLVDEECLKDVCVYFGQFSITKANSVIMSLLSPVWKATICRGLSRKSEKQVNLEHGDYESFRRIMELGCGKKVVVPQFQDLISIGRMADLYCIEGVCQAIIWESIRHLNLSRAAEVLARTELRGLSMLLEASKEVARTNFDEFSRTEAFMSIGHDELASILDQDDMIVSTEEIVFESLVRWMSCGSDEILRGQSLMGKVRFYAMNPDYVKKEACKVLPTSRILPQLLARAMQDEPEAIRLQQPRGRFQISWERFSAGQEKRCPISRRRFLVATSGVICQGKVCWGISSGEIFVRYEGRSDNLAVLRAHDQSVSCLAAWRGHLVSGCDDGTVRIWDLSRLRCVGELEGHKNDLRCLVVAADRLLAGCADGSVRVWSWGTVSNSWLCVRTVLFRSAVNCMACAYPRVYCPEGTHIMVWDLLAPEKEPAMLGSHIDRVTSMVVDGDYLYSAGMDKVVKQWSIEQGKCVRRDDVCLEEANKFVGVLTVHGNYLVGGTRRRYHFSGNASCNILVWDKRNLDLQHVLEQPPNTDVNVLLPGACCVRASVGSDLAVYGYEADIPAPPKPPPVVQRNDLQLSPCVYESVTLSPTYPCPWVSYQPPTVTAITQTIFPGLELMPYPVSNVVYAMQPILPETTTAGWALRRVGIGGLPPVLWQPANSMGSLDSRCSWFGEFRLGCTANDGSMSWLQVIFNRF